MFTGNPNWQVTTSSLHKVDPNCNNTQLRFTWRKVKDNPMIVLQTLVWFHISTELMAAENLTRKTYTYPNYLFILLPQVIWVNINESSGYFVPLT